jgi:hypothetical protein
MRGSRPSPRTLALLAMLGAFLHRCDDGSPYPEQMMPELPPGWEWDGSVARQIKMGEYAAPVARGETPDHTARIAWGLWSEMSGVTREQWEALQRDYDPERKTIGEYSENINNAAIELHNALMQLTLGSGPLAMKVRKSVIRDARVFINKARAYLDNAEEYDKKLLAAGVERNKVW